MGQEGALACELEGLVPHGREVREITAGGVSYIQEGAVSRRFRVISFAVSGTRPLSPVDTISVPAESFIAKERLGELLQKAQSLPHSEQQALMPLLGLMEAYIDRGLPWHALEIGTAAEPAVEGLTESARRADAPCDGLLTPDWYLVAWRSPSSPGWECSSAGAGGVGAAAAFAEKYVGMHR